MKYIIQREINDIAVAYAEALRDLTLEGYTVQFNDIRRSAQNNGQRSKIVLMKPEDVQWLQENLLEKAKLEAGFNKSDVNVEDYVILRLPHNVSWPDWNQLLSQHKQAKPKYFEYVTTGRNFGVPVESHAGRTGLESIKNGEWCKSIRYDMAKAFLVYESDLEGMTDEVTTLAEELYQVYAEQKASEDGRRKKNKPVPQENVAVEEDKVQESVEIELPNEDTDAESNV